ncbi:Na+/H+-dicarboxylate symporter [Thiogranum longum]|uniref:Na+/H+-dicarboxylate symporter n=1 Tax=Thiogranum longum TaxID=1537524 RepID=A0A4R1HEM5_9GAMM|nr:dicarboxylate/amino acid:cation symporter [Thiogranum longum]TCK17799.1 Na+/H+-dicarboxylate symporter [Thiogranum longum]
MLRLQLHWQILIALVLAVVAGRLSGVDGDLLGVTLYPVYEFIGALFMNALKMIIVPLIVSTIITGVSGLGNTQGLGRLSGKTLLFYLTTSLLAIMVGLMFVNLINPGIIDGTPAREVLGLSEAAANEAAQKVQGRSASDLTDVFLSMVPPNVVAAAANGQMLGLIFFSLLFGYFLTRIDREAGDLLSRFWSGVADVMMAMTGLIMKFAPLGVFGLVAKTVAEIGPDQLNALAFTLGSFTLSVLLALAFHVLVTLPLLLWLVGRVNPVKQFQAMMPAMLTAFSTASSSATLPLTIECVRDNAKVSNRTASFVLPLGATVNMDGTALYECVAAMFIAQAYGLQLDLVTQFTVVLVALLTSIGVAGIPAASLVAITIILATIGLPVEAIGLILAVDRILDMFRTSVNVFSDSCGAVIIARTEGETGVLQG